MRKLVIIGGLAAAIGGGVLFLQSREPAESQGPAYTTAKVERRTLEVVAEAAGLIEPVQVVEVKSKASGEVLRVLVETGDVVKKGALLAEIDPRDVQNALDQAVADLEAARVRSVTTKAHLERMETLRKSGVVTQQEYETAVEAAASARSAVVRGETNLQLARERRNDVVIRAPNDGTVLQRDVQPGQIIASAIANVSGGTALFKTADLSEMQVRAKVDETDIGKVRAGVPAQVTVEAYPGKTFRGEVLKVEPQAVVEQNVTMFPVLVRLKNPDGLLKPGMNAEVKLQIDRRRDAVTVPNSAVVSMRDLRGAAAALGLDEEAVRSTLRPSGGAPSAECAALREKVAAAGGPDALEDSDRAALEECRSQAKAAFGGGSDEGEVRPGVVFVKGGSGMEPRRVLLGLSDWEYSEVVKGLEADEEVVLISVAQLQKKQQEASDRMRQRIGGVVPGAGGAPRGGGRR